MSRGKRLGARRRKLLSARDPDIVEKSMKRAMTYVPTARENMRRFDELEPLWRALINYFGADVCARVQHVEPEKIPAKLGQKAEFEKYYEEAYGRRMRDAAREEKERIASAWDGIL